MTISVIYLYERNISRTRCTLKNLRAKIGLDAPHGKKNLDVRRSRCCFVSFHLELRQLPSHVSRESQTACNVREKEKRGTCMYAYWLESQAAPCWESTVGSLETTHDVGNSSAHSS